VPTEKTDNIQDNEKALQHSTVAKPF